MIAMDGKPTVANRVPLDPPRSVEDEGSIIIADEQTIYETCRENTTNTFDWLACVEARS